MTRWSDAAIDLACLIAMCGFVLLAFAAAGVPYGSVGV